MIMARLGSVARFSAALVVACWGGLTGVAAQTYALQQAKLSAADPGVLDRFGDSVAVWGDTAVIGAPNDDHAAGADAGSAYIFVLRGTAWERRPS